MNKGILVIACTVFSIGLNAQQAVQNNGNLRVHTGGSVSCFGNMTNAAAAVLVNDGALYIKGNLVNDEASMSAGTGTLHLDGASAQAVNGSQPMRTNDLVTNNAAGITLNNDLGIGGAHTFTAGLIHTSATPNYIIYESGASHSGSADSRHVTGWVKKNGNTGFTFPVGDNTYLRSIAISNLSAASEFNCHYYTPTQNIYNLFSPLVNVKANEYWQLDKISGGSAQVTLNWDHSKVAMDQVFLADVRAGHYTGGNWTSEGGTAIGDVTTTGSVTSTAIISFSPFTLAYTSFPIPLKLISFTGWRNSGVSYLHWVSENEQDVSHFSVERSFNGTSFTSIGTVPALNRGIRELYSFNDPSSFTGAAYYRLKNIDNDGSYSYSRIIRVSESAAQGSSFVVLNPVQSAITIFNKTAPAGLYDYYLLNTSGQLIQKGTVNMNNNGGSIIRLPLQMAHGIYTLELRKDRSGYSQQILVQQ